jgi:hypothetical protein
MELAQRSFDNAFTGLGGVLKQQEATDQANWNQIKENNTQDFLNKLYSAQGAEGFKALQDSGQLEQMLAANGAQIDRAAARSAMDGRLSTLQNRDTQAITYKNTMLDDAQANAVRRINTLALTDPAAASAELAKNPDLRKSFEIAKNIDASAQTQVERERAKTRFGFDMNEEQRKAAEEAQRALLRPLTVQEAQNKLDLFPLQKQQTQAQINASNASVAASNENVLTSRANRDRIEAEAEKARDLKKLGAALDGNIYKEGVFKDADTVDLAKLMKDTGVGGTGSDAGEKRTKIIDRVNSLAKTGIEIKGPDGKPVTVPLPLGAVKASILGSSNTLLSWNEGYADSFEKNLKARMQAVYNKAGADGKPIAANKAVDDYQNFLAIMRGTAEIAPAPSTKRK